MPASSTIPSSPVPPWWQFNGHIQTILPSLLRKVKLHSPRRERIDTPDGDFLDLDWYAREAKHLIIISHGLEGDSYRPYVLGMAGIMYEAGYDCLAWNYRGCSGEMNRQKRFYHSGATDDLHTVLQHVLAQKKYEAITLVGFSLGGNLTLKYLGEQGEAAQGIIQSAATFSVPLNLDSSCTVISQPGNWVYSERFLRSLRKKVKEKEAAMPGTFDLVKLEQIKTLREFDDHFTGPMHGFRDAVDYYTQCSSIHFLDGIRVPTLVVNALNDPFLAPDCFPEAAYRDHPHIRMECPVKGGHVGFRHRKLSPWYWSEHRALDFVRQIAVKQ